MDDIRAQIAALGAEMLRRRAERALGATSEERRVKPLTPLTAADVALIYKDRRRVRDIAEAFDVEAGVVHTIKSRKTWRHVTASLGEAGKPGKPPTFDAAARDAYRKQFPNPPILEEWERPPTTGPFPLHLKITQYTDDHYRRCFAPPERSTETWGLWLEMIAAASDASDSQ